MSIKIQEAPELEIYVSEAGYVCIKQYDYGQGEESIIHLAPCQLAVVMRAFLSLVKEYDLDVNYYGGTIKPEEFEAAGIDLNQPFQLEQEKQP